MSKTENHVTETPDLETLLGIGTPLSKEKEYDAKAARLLAVREQIKALKEEERKLEDAIWTLTPEEPGEFTVPGEQYVFTVARSELWKWDSKKLEAIAAKEEKVSAVVKTTYTLDKKEHLPLLGILTPAIVKELDDALTRKPGAPRVKVSRKA